MADVFFSGPGSALVLLFSSCAFLWSVSCSVPRVLWWTVAAYAILFPWVSPGRLDFHHFLFWVDTGDHFQCCSQGVSHSLPGWLLGFLHCVFLWFALISQPSHNSNPAWHTDSFPPWRLPCHSAECSLAWLLPLSKCNSQPPSSPHLLIVFTRHQTHRQAGVPIVGTWHQSQSLGQSHAHARLKTVRYLSI